MDNIFKQGDDIYLQVPVLDETGTTLPVNNTDIVVGFYQNGIQVAKYSKSENTLIYVDDTHYYVRVQSDTSKAFSIGYIDVVIRFVKNSDGFNPKKTEYIHKNYFKVDRGYFKNETLSISVAKTLTTNTTNITVECLPSQYNNFSIYSNINWIVYSNASWVTFSNAIGADNSGLFYFTTTENPTVNERCASVIVYGEGVIPKAITIKQVAPYVTLNDTATAFAGTAGSNGSVVITSNSSWSITNNYNWLSVSKYSNTGISATTVTFTALTDNITGFDRVAVIEIFNAQLGTQIFTVTQYNNA